MTIAEQIYKVWAARDNEPLRSHLGASGIGAPCERAIQLGYRHAFKPKFGGRIHRLFDVGHKFEDRLIAELQSIGLDVRNQDDNGRQFRLGDPDGLCGSCDGFIEIDGEWMILEAKTHNEKSFKGLEKGVKESKPQHFAQMQVYMGYAGLRRALYAAENKNNSELYFEIVEFEQPVFDAMQARAGRVQGANELLPEIAGASETFYLCKWCDAFAVCQIGEVPLVGCRTCMHWSAPNKCELGGACSDEPQECHVFHPMFAPWKPVAGDVDWVRYDNGVINCARAGFPAVEGEQPACVLTSDEIKERGVWNAVDEAASSMAGSVPHLWRDDGERFSRNEDGTYTMDSNRSAQPTCYYRYTFKRLMDTGAFSCYAPNELA